MESAWRDSAAEGDEAGFTLIELMVVLLIMAILMAIAIPTFLGVRVGAEDRSAQSDVVNAAIAAKSLFATNGSFPTTPSSVSQLGSSEPELSFTSGTVTSVPAHSISAAVSTDFNGVILGAESVDGRCWYIEVNEEQSALAPPGLNYARANQGLSYSGTPKSLGAQASCNAALIGTSTFLTWGASFPN